MQAKGSDQMVPTPFNPAILTLRENAEFFMQILYLGLQQLNVI